jgi:hypothetical protein
VLAAHKWDARLAHLHSGDSLVVSELSRLGRNTGELDRLLDLVAVSVDFHDYARFAGRLPHVDRYGDGSYSIERPALRTPDDDLWKRFVITTALRIGASRYDN